METLVDRRKGDAIVDYRKGEDAVVSEMREALERAGVENMFYAFDGISAKESTVRGGLERVQKGLRKLKEGEASWYLTLLVLLELVYFG